MSVSFPRPCRAGLKLILTVAVALPVMPALAVARPHSSARASRHHHRHVHKPVASALAAPSACTDTTLAPSPETVDRAAAATLCLINRQRAAQGLAALHPNAALTAAATSQSQDMVARDYFAHVGPSGVGLLDRLRQTGYIRPGAGYSIAENIASATGALATPQETVNAWMNSPEHRANILSPAYQDTGIGVVAAAPAIVGSGPGATYTEEFGRAA